ncbi:MAG: LysE family transporter [Desulfomonilia bacterium]|jgi:threonine/homoserine/homoserine lactone efflux protein|nr:LysE family translocator [Deltaproteobacteria bacterium]MDX9761025.1 LysE family transporter [Desulfomonilia bacterium]HPW68231.1 LysE family transporter [Deltaproteobacteria bacterium]
MAAYLISGAVFGLSAGLAPGPLLTLVLTETLQHGSRAGIRVAFAPLVTDLPIVILSLFVIARLAGSPLVMGWISLLGAGFVAYLGYETFVSRKAAQAGQGECIRSLRKGVIANLLNPHPYLFWMTVGSPMVIRALHEGMLGAGSFLAGFYVFLVGSKAGLSLLAGRTRHLLKGRVYRVCMMTLGILLWLFAVALARDALRFMAS